MDEAFWVLGLLSQRSEPVKLCTKTFVEGYAGLKRETLASSRDISRRVASVTWLGRRMHHVQRSTDQGRQNVEHLGDGCASATSYVE